MGLFPVPKGLGDLERMGLLNHPVEVLRLPDAHKDLILGSKGVVGWEYSATSSIFGMSKELPMVLTKKNGSAVSLGIPFEDQRLMGF